MYSSESGSWFYTNLNLRSQKKKQEVEKEQKQKESVSHLFMHKRIQSIGTQTHGPDRHYSLVYFFL